MRISLSILGLSLLATPIIAKSSSSSDDAFTSGAFCLGSECGTPTTSGNAFSSGAFSLGSSPTQTSLQPEWTIDIHPHNPECKFGKSSYKVSYHSSACVVGGGESLYFHNKQKPKCQATTFSGDNCRGSSVADLRSDLCNSVTFGSVNVTCEH